jgi:ArsR family transcriptional regulator
MEPRSDPPPAPKVATEATKTCCGPSEPFAAQADAEEQLATFCKALGHPHRVHILRFLASQQACFAGEIANQLPVAASTVSQHLSLLKDSGLIRGEVDGPRRNYCIDPNALDLLKRLVAAL